MFVDTHEISSEILDQVSQTVARLHGAVDQKVHASIIVPVNAQSDLLTVSNLLGDLKQYHGQYNLEMILVINNYLPDNPPAAIEDYRKAGLIVVAEPVVRRQGEVVIVSARAFGVRAANSTITIHFDADCRIPNPTALLNWYINVLQSGAALAYSHVSFYELRPMLSIKTKIAIHHMIRFIKRNLLGIPTTRGSNYAVNRQKFLDLYNSHKISVDMQIGPAVKITGAKIAYSGRKEDYVYTSGRRFKGQWGKMPRYFHNRLIYNIRSLAILRKKHSSQTWKGFDLENNNRQSFVAPIQDEILRQAEVKNVSIKDR